MMGSSVRMLFLNVGWFKFPCEEEQAVGRKAQCVEKVQAGNTAVGGVVSLRRGVTALRRY